MQHREGTWHNDQATKDTNKLSLMKQITQHNTTNCISNKHEQRATGNITPPRNIYTRGYEGNTTTNQKLPH
jgi:hypothetical protein